VVHCGGAQGPALRDRGERVTPRLRRSSTGPSLPLALKDTASCSQAVA
jgi:hypothetical protein